jgi:hypothetical protein
VLPGKRFRLQRDNGVVELQVSPRQTTRSEQVEFRVEKPRGRAYLLWANLGGSYLPQPAADFSARSLILSYSIRFSAAAGRGKNT